MLTQYKVSQILNMVKDKYFDILNDELIFIKESNEFSFSTLAGVHDIEFRNEFEKSAESEYLQHCLNNKLADTFYNLAPNLLECFAVLHEIGHLIDYVKNGNKINNTGYTEFKTKQYLSLTQAMAQYRQIPAEAYADNFAIDFINSNIKELWFILDPQANKEEVEFFTGLN